MGYLGYFWYFWSNAAALEFYVCIDGICSNVNFKKYKLNIMTIAVDFDGTCVTHDFPKVGKNIGAEIVLKKLADKGHKIILYTMRSHPSEKTENAEASGMTSTTNDCLQDAIDWFAKYGIPLYGVNDNPSQHSWTDSPKVYANMYIDDAALGIPLVYEDMKHMYDNSVIRPYVGWVRVSEMLYESGVLTYNDLMDIIEEFNKRY